MKALVFFNNKSGVGKTSLAYHLTWMFRELGLNVVAIDLDPQSNLTSAFLSDERLELLWPDGDHPLTALGCVQPLLERLGDFNKPHVEDVAERLGLIAGDLGLSMFEDRLSAAWSACLSDIKADATDGFRVTTSFYRIMKSAAEQRGASIAVIDVGPNLGALNRAALVASDYVVTPLGADLYSLQGLKNLGPKLREWRNGWKKRLEAAEELNLPIELPSGAMNPVGYIVLNPSIRDSRPVKAYRKWVDRIPQIYSSQVLGDGIVDPTPETDSNALSVVKHYKSLMPLAQEADKPMFFLKAKDGAIGGHASAVTDSYRDYEELARKILLRCDIPLN